VIPPQLKVFPFLATFLTSFGQTAQPCRTGNTRCQKFPSFHLKILLSKTKHNSIVDKPNLTFASHIKRNLFIRQNKNNRMGSADITGYMTFSHLSGSDVFLIELCTFTKYLFFATKAPRH